MNKRLELLEKLVASGRADSFARYGLAMELRKAGELDRALAAFQALRDVDPDYVPQYLMAAQMLYDAGRVDEARGWVEAGIRTANARGDGHAAGELEALHALL